jgi:hypothetical protein
VWLSPLRRIISQSHRSTFSCVGSAGEDSGPDEALLNIGVWGPGLTKWTNSSTLFLGLLRRPKLKASLSIKAFCLVTQRETCETLAESRAFLVKSTQSRPLVSVLFKRNRSCDLDCLLSRSSPPLSKRSRGSTDSMNRHNDAVALLSNTIAEFYARQLPFRIYHDQKI